jgi:mRNA interferase RelE/StbE
VYEVLLERRAQRDVDRLPKSVSGRAIRAIAALGAEPRPAGCRKLGGSDNDWRIRIGDYRVIYEIDDRARQVRVMYIRHRRDAYR